GDIPTGCPSGPPDLVRHQWITSPLGLRGPVGTQAVGTGPAPTRPFGPPTPAALLARDGGARNGPRGRPPGRAPEAPPPRPRPPFGPARGHRTRTHIPGMANGPPPPPKAAAAGGRANTVERGGTVGVCLPDRVREHLEHPGRKPFCV